MPGVPGVSLPWLVALVNEFASAPRQASGKAGEAYPELFSRADAPMTPRPKERDLVDIAERLWQVFAQSANRDRARALNRLLDCCATLSPRVDDRGTLNWTISGRSARGRLLAACATSLLEAVQAHGWERLGVCAAAYCQYAYLDIDGRGARRYCSHACLNRARVRSYRARHDRRSARE